MKKFSELVDLDVKQALQDDRKIRQIIARILPPDGLERVQFCRIENRILKLTLDNSSWLARLRFSSGQIIDELNSEGITTSQATWHVAPERARAEPRAKTFRSRERSQSSANILRTTAEGMESDELQRALLKVAEQLAKRSEDSKH